MSEPATTLTPAAGPDSGLSAGAMLLAGREAAGLTLDAVAQQLKLAPRQVLALERNDFPQLPGRTFIRGFIRNYARLVRIDPEMVLAALPDATSAAHGGSLAATPQSMGELPAEAHRNVNWARWLIPLAMLAVVAATAYYEFVRPHSSANTDPSATTARDVAKTVAASRGFESAAPTPAPSGASTAATPVDPATSGGTGASVALPNPLAATDGPKAESPSGERAPTAMERADAARKVDGTLATSAATNATSAATAPMLIDFRGTSWVQVKDATGAIVLSLTGNPGSSQVVNGAPPFEVVIGNIDAVTLTFQGRPVDLSSFAKQNVARMTLK